MVTRSPICSVLGHVDHGKSSILDLIRSSCIVKGEAGAITQSIGASIVPMEVIRSRCGTLLNSLNQDFTIPGLLFIDTPGHAAFTSLRKRGGNLADIAVLVVDINEGFKPQTIEAIQILKAFKTPFVVAANKVDLINGWRTNSQKGILKNIQSQNENVITTIETKLYELVGKISEYGFPSERFDRVESFTKEIAIIPCSAKTGEGIPELMMVLAGLAQKFLEQSLNIDVKGQAKASILEVKKQKAGTTLDVIVYDGVLKANDTIVIGGFNEAIVTKVRGLFEPSELAEMRDSKSKFNSVKEVHAAIGVRILAPNTDDVTAGMPLRVANQNNIEKIKEEIQKEVSEVLIETCSEGIIIKADTIGSLEALTKLLNDKGIEIMHAAIGEISKKDVSIAESNIEKEPLNAVILGFNVKVSPNIENEEVKIITSDIIYQLLDSLEQWKEEKQKELYAQQLDNIVRPCKIEVLKNCIFRASNPCVCGIEVLNGELSSGMQLMKSDGSILGNIKSMQKDKENVKKAIKKEQLAISMPGVTAGRQLFEEDILYSSIPEQDFIKLKNLRKYLTKPEIDVLKEIAEIKRKENPVWGV